MNHKVSRSRLKHYFNKTIDLSFTKKIEDEVDFLVGLTEILRPNKVKGLEEVDISELIILLEENRTYLKSFSYYLSRLISQKDFDKILADAAILRDTDFFHEVKKRLFAKIIPEQSSKDTLQGILNEVFYKQSDPFWIEKIPSAQLETLFNLLDFKPIYTVNSKNFPIEELIFSLEVIVHRICGRAMESEVISMVPELQNFESPFLAFQREFTELNDRLLRSDKKYATSEDLHYKHLLILHRQCEIYVETAFKNSGKYGISLRVNQSLLRIRHQLERIKELLPFLVLDSHENAKHKTIALCEKIIKYNCNKNNLRKLVNESTQLLSYEITQHTAKTGEHYITSTREEYFKMFKTALGGGFVVAFLCILKIFVSNADTSDFGTAFLLSMNYGIGFVIIYICGGTLATKQPAMTASALITALQKDVKNQTAEKYDAFARFFARVFRSQFAALMGNILMVMPTALFLVWIIDVVFKVNLAEPKWEYMIHELNPIDTPAVLYAAIAGFFLFLSGIIAGSIANRDKHHRIYYRLQEHPFLKRTFGKKVTAKFAKLYEKKWAGIVSNFSLGVFLGSIAPIALFFGLGLDIRHVTFSSGNYALSMYGSGFELPFRMFFLGAFGIAFIGMFNFFISFILSLILAFRSRNIRLLELRKVVVSIWKYFWKKPVVFFFPPKTEENLTT